MKLVSSFYLFVGLGMFISIGAVHTDVVWIWIVFMFVSVFCAACGFSYIEAKRCDFRRKK